MDIVKICAGELLAKGYDNDKGYRACCPCLHFCCRARDWAGTGDGTSTALGILRFRPGCLLFAGDGHGFKKAESIEGALDAARDWYSDISHCLLGPKGLPRTQHFLSGTPSKIFSVPISTRIYSASFFHKRLQLVWAHVAASDITQCPRPFADRLVIGSTSRREANDGCK
jgi:hypothetical protein